MKFSKYIILTAISLLIFDGSLLSQKNKKAEPKKKKDKSSIYSGLKFRSIGPAFTSGRIADFSSGLCFTVCDAGET